MGTQIWEKGLADNLRVINETSERDWVNRKGAHDYLVKRGCVIAYKTFERWAENRKGPPFVHIAGTVVRYYKPDLDKWLAENVRYVD